MATPVYEIYALKYAGPFVRPAPMILWFQDLERTISVNYYIFVIRGGSETIVVDCGVSPQLAVARNLFGYVSPAEVLRRIDIEAAKVRHVIATHIHFDHVSGISLFPHATVYLQEKEYAFWATNPVAKRPPFLHVSDPAANRYVARLHGTGRLRLLRGDRNTLPGIELLLCPGHTLGMQAVAVNTASGTAIVGSDVGHTFENYARDLPSAIITDMVAWMASFDKLRARVSAPDLLFPGHDVALMKRYPHVAPDVTRLV